MTFDLWQSLFRSVVETLILQQRKIMACLHDKSVNAAAQAMRATCNSQDSQLRFFKFRKELFHPLRVQSRSCVAARMPPE